MILIQNHSIRVHDGDVLIMTRAVSYQAHKHAEPLWGLAPVRISFISNSTPIPPGSYVIGIFDASDQPGALGWHTEDPHGNVYGKVFASPVLDHAGMVLHGGPATVASVLSHEVLEAILDPHANLWAENGSGISYAYEACDAVENDSYDVKVDGQPVSLSNFVTRDWFDPEAPPGTRMDYLNNLKKPMTMTSGGYVVTMTNGHVAQQFGDEMPQWQIAGKQHELARTARRMKEGHGTVPAS